MKIAIAHIESTAPYSQGRHYDKEEAPELSDKEAKDAYEARTWRHRLHVTKEGFVEIPGTAFANALKEATKRLKLKVPGKGRVEFTKYFVAGVMCTKGIVLPVKPEDVQCDRLFVPSDGTTGGGKRVFRHFPRIDQWSGEVMFYIFDDVITEDVFRQALESAGILVGIGRFRPERNGFYGRFTVKKIDWQEDASVSDEAAE